MASKREERGTAERTGEDEEPEAAWAEQGRAVDDAGDAEERAAWPAMRLDTDAEEARESASEGRPWGPGPDDAQTWESSVGVEERRGPPERDE